MLCVRYCKFFVKKLEFFKIWLFRAFLSIHPDIVVVTKKPPMRQIMCSTLYCMNGSIEDRRINWRNSYECNSDLIARSVLLEFF